jgi:hypothetical protein
MRVLLVAVGVLVLGTLLARFVAPSQGAPSLGDLAGDVILVGVDDNSLLWTDNTTAAVAAEDVLGVTAVRVTIQWTAGRTVALDNALYLERAEKAARLGQRVVLEIYGDPSSPPLTGAMRDAYCSYAVDALSRAPDIHDIVIWNEANSARFWRPQAGAAAAYEALLADCYDMLHAYRQTINVISSTAPHENPLAFIAGLGVAYRASGRTQPIFDTFGHDAYPESSRESPFAQHPNTLSADEGDYVRLMQQLTAAFGGTGQPVPGKGSVPMGGNLSNAEIAALKPPPVRRSRTTTTTTTTTPIVIPGGPVTIWYLEDGFETIVPPAKRQYYHGAENNTLAIPALVQSAGDGPDQSSQLRNALELAYCQPAVGAFFNFELTDDPSRAGWQSGLLWADGTPKPSYAIFRQAIQWITAHQVDCSQLPAAATGLGLPA